MNGHLIRTRIYQNSFTNIQIAATKKSVIASKMLGIIVFIFFLSSQGTRKKPENLRKMQLLSVGNKSLYLIFVWVIFLSMLDCFYSS
jgi:hypothetical protein